jgi:hypothetical protein
MFRGSFASISFAAIGMELHRLASTKIGYASRQRKSDRSCHTLARLTDSPLADNIV